MPTLRRALAAMLLTALLVPTLALAQAQPEAESEPETAADQFLLDEYNVEVFGASDSDRIAAGLTFGTVYGNGWWWNAGPRLSWIRWNVDVPNQDGIGLGGTFGGGWHPEKTVSPYAAIALDRAFNVSEIFDWQMLVHVGARVKVTQDQREYFSMTFSVYEASTFGGDGPHGSDFGIAVLYSAALFAKRK
jgi:hypothetical protein